MDNSVLVFREPETGLASEVVSGLTSWQLQNGTQTRMELLSILMDESSSNV